MFNNLKSFLRGRDFLSDALGEFSSMLSTAESIYSTVLRALLNNEQIPDLKKIIYAEDDKINKAQRSIRKKILNHLITQPTVDSSTCLMLMSVVKDAERLGDYVKNLFEVIDLKNEPMDRTEYEKYFGDTDQQVLKLFSQAREAFMSSDEEKAAKSWDYEKNLAVRFDEILVTIAKSDLPTNQAICFALIARYYKRIMAHLTNIGTAVILPLDQLDYYDEKRIRA